MEVKGQMTCFKHEGFWQCMDNLRDNKYLNNLSGMRAILPGKFGKRDFKTKHINEER